MQTLDLLHKTQVGYHDFFLGLTQQFSPQWYQSAENIFQTTIENSDPAAAALLRQWRRRYHQCLIQFPESEMNQVSKRLGQTNPATVLLRPKIEAVWEPITGDDNWQPFYGLVKQVQNPFIEA